jgi:hypothetical protein
MFKRFCKHLTYWAKYLGISHWQIRVFPAHGPDEVRKESIDDDSGFAGGVTTLEPAYERASVVLCTQEDTHWLDEMLNETALHELIHVMWSSITELTPDEVIETVAHRMVMEAATTHMTRAILGLYRRTSGMASSRRSL